jgi:hypothetical protein
MFKWCCSVKKNNKNSKNFALINFCLNTLDIYLMVFVNVITTKMHICKETSVAYVKAAKVLMSFPRFRISFIVIYMGRICDNI